MNTFLKFAKRESRRLTIEHNEITTAAYQEHPHGVAMAIEQESAEARLCLAEELEIASGIVRGSIKTAIKLNFIGALRES